MGCQVACVVGTRPEAIKMAPVVLRLRQPDSGFYCRLISTGQHRELLRTALADFGLAPDEDLEVMRAGQGLAELTSRALVALDGCLQNLRPDIVLSQGDTTTVLCSALASHYQRIPFGHVEAGLRTGRRYSPFPEEVNRILVSHLAQWHFAPTEGARQNLLREGIDDASIFVTGNTVIDALGMMADRGSLTPFLPPGIRFVLVTAHRRENWGEPMEQLGLALRDLVVKHAYLHVVFPVHLNPAVRDPLHALLSGLDRVHLVEPAGYPEFVALMKRATLILTDSGGVQEEATALGKLVLLLRDETERPEAVATGLVRVVGTDRGVIVGAVNAYLQSRPPTPSLGNEPNPFGDGHAAERIYQALATVFGLVSTR